MRLVTIPYSHARTVPRPGSNRRRDLNAARNASAATSSAASRPSRLAT